jgi:hypothetical protein
MKLMSFVAGIYIVLLAFAMLEIRSSTVEAKPCLPHAVYGLIGERYNSLRGSDGPLGCPLTDEQSTREPHGRLCVQ